MKLVECSVTEFINIVESDAPAPGGGSVSAFAGTVGVALTAMVAALTVGKEKYKDHDALMNDTITQSQELKEKLLIAIDEDTAAFIKVTDVFKMPKGTDDEKELRKQAMQEALKFATKAPFGIMECSFEALKLTKALLGKFNLNAASDLGVSALNLKSSVLGAWLNVLINVGGIKDEEFVEEYKTKGEDLVAKTVAMADEVYNEIIASL